jgi:Sec-independent protein secretion pathway component TatC
MFLSVGFPELLAIASVSVVMLVLYARGDARCRWLFAGSVCATLAAILTPADLASMAILFLAFLGIFMMGVQYRPHRVPTA